MTAKGNVSYKKDQQYLLFVVFAVAFAVRLILQFTPLPDLLANRIEISTPVTSYKKLREGLFLYDQGIDPYEGGVCHQAPILLSLLSSVRTLPLASLAEKVFYSALDLLVAWQILDVNSSPYLAARVPSQLKLRSWVIASIVLLNPFSILVATSKSSAVFSSIAILGAINNALQGQALASMFGLSLATFLSFYPVLLIAPLTLVLAGLKSQSIRAAGGQCTIMFLACLATWLYTSYAWLGSWNFLRSNYSILLLMTDLTPNIGLWWYFFTEMFEDFRAFFLGVFQLHLLIYIVPLCIKLNDPLFVCITLCGLAAIFKPYPSIADTNLYFCLLCVTPHLFNHLRYLFLVGCALLYCCIFGPAFYYLWIYAGSGNANFFYAITLVWNLTQGILLSDLVFACMKDEWENEDAAARKGREIEVVQTSD